MDTTDSDGRRLDPIDQAEAEMIASALAVQVRQGTFPPDDAYAWAVYVCKAMRPAPTEN